MPLFVRYYGNATANNASTVTLSSFTVTSGNTGVIYLFAGKNSTTVFPAHTTAGIYTDTLGNKWVVVPQIGPFNGSMTSTSVLPQCWILIGNITTGGTASLTVGVQGSSTTTSSLSLAISGCEFSGTLSLVDQTAANSGVGDPSNPANSTIVTGQANEVVVGLISNGSVTAIGSGWSSPGASGSSFGWTGYQIVSSSGTSVQISGASSFHSGQQYITGICSLYQTAPATLPPIPYADYGRNHSTGVVGSIALSSVTMTVGNLAVIQVGLTGTTGITFTLADTLGNTWTAIPNTYQSGASGGADSTQMFYSKITTGGTSTITATLSSSAQFALISGVEFANAGTGIEQTASAQVASTTSPSTTITPTRTGELCIVGFWSTAAGFNAPNNGGSNTPFVVAQSSTQSGFDSWFGYFINTSTSTLTMAATSGAATTWTTATAAFFSLSTDKAASGDGYIFPWYANKVASGDAWIVAPQVRTFGDAYITNPSNIHVLVSPVNLAGNILFKIDPISGYVRFNATIGTALRSFVHLAATIKSTTNRISVNLGARIQVGVRNYVKLIGTIQYPMTRAASGDAVIASGYTRVYARLAAKIIQKVGTGVGAGGSGGAQGAGSYPPQSYVRLGAWIVNPRGGIP